MYSIRRWLYKPKKDDNSILAQFFYADEDLNYVAAELDSFDGRKDPERCTQLVNQLRQSQDKVLSICNQIMDEMIPDQRANRDFRVKFPDDVLQENLAGQLWFGAECLAAGSSIMDREVESASMRPLAKALTKTLDNVRTMLREQCLRNPTTFSDKLRESLRIFDRLFAEFELSYVSAMVPVKTMREYDIQQNVIVLFSETLQRALRIGLITEEMVDDYDPALMFTIPRLAIVCGLLICPEGPLNLDVDPNDMSEMFRPFKTLLRKIRELLWSLNKQELYTLEKALCSLEDPGKFKNAESKPNVSKQYPLPDIDGYVQKVCVDYPSCKQFISDFYNGSNDSPASEQQLEVTSTITTTTATTTELMTPGSEVGEPDSWTPDLVSTGEDLTALQESLSNALTKVIDRSATRDSGLHSDSCSSNSCENVNSIASSSHASVTFISGNVAQVSSSGDDGGAASSSTSDAHNVVSSLIDDVIASVTCSLRYENAVQSSSSSIINRRNGQSSASANSSPYHNLHPKRHKPFRSHPSSPCPWTMTSPSRKTTIPHNAHVISSEFNNHGYSTSCSSCQSISSSDWETESCSSDTSSYNSECQDDEEIALAILAAEVASRFKTRGRFTSVEDLIHRLFVCISGVADQLQTNYASDLRNILKAVFQINCSEPLVTQTPETTKQDTRNRLNIDARNSAVERISVDSAEEANEQDLYHTPLTSEEPPLWVPDELAPHCMSCKAQFTVVRRRHHCRNCGKVFCSRCSSNSVPLPRYGHQKPVRVCNRCFIFQVTPFLIEEAT